MSFAVSMVIRAWPRPRTQLWPLLICIVQSNGIQFQLIRSSN